MNTELRGKVAIVTGATRRRGLGRAIAVALARAGADVVVTGSGLRRAEDDLPRDERGGAWGGAEDVAAELTALGVRARSVGVDVTDGAAVAVLMADTARDFGRIDILVNNAAYPRGDDRVELVDLDEAVWRRIVDTNLTGTMLCCKHAIPHMARAGGGSIVSISSGAAVKGPPTFSAYAASKAGVHALNAVIAAETGRHGITANVVAPGILDTARIDMLREDGRWEQRLAANPMGRAGTPQEVAELVRWLCGPHSRWITGEVFLVNGGEVRRAAN